MFRICLSVSVIVLAERYGFSRTRSRAILSLTNPSRDSKIDEQPFLQDRVSNMTATQDKWLNRLPDSSESSGTYWAYCAWTLNIELATVEWIAETKTHKICMPYFGVVMSHSGGGTFMRDHRWLRIEEPDMASPDWIDKLPDLSGEYWACNIETQETFVVRVGSPCGIDEPEDGFETVYVPEFGSARSLPNYNAFLRNHRWLGIVRPSPPPETPEETRTRRHHESYVEYERRHTKLSEDRAAAYERLIKAMERARELGCNDDEIHAEYKRQYREFREDRNKAYERLDKELKCLHDAAAEGST